MITVLVSGQSLPINADNALSPLERLGYLTQLSLNFDCSTELFGGACAAFATSSSSSKLMLWVDCKEVEPLTVDHEYWAWLAYTFWSKASKCSVRDLTIRGIGLSCRGIAAFEATLQQNYPKAELDIVPTTSSHSCEYGYVNIQAGVQLNLMDNRNVDYVLLHDCRCRAQYDSTTNSDVVEAIVPGYGMCTVALNEGRCEFLPDKSGVIVSTPNDLQSLKLDFAKVESEVILMNLLTHIGGNLRSLTLELNNETVYSANNRIASIDLSGVMNACPHLEEITFQNIQVYLSPYSELRNWNLKKLAMYDVDDDNSLNVCLRVLDDETLRTSRELVELDISLPRFGTRPYSTIQNHVAAMVTHDRKFLPVAKDKFPIESKAAMISVLSYNQPLEPSSVVHLLNPRILSLVFEYAATAEQRSVQITYLGRPVGVGLH
ncbi:hypothetical protein PHMEG_00010982 [Phytophthora megakarya]|uniref:Uncharacterized protein n=1 Tax=Phytophthora megakarya TaxID=4795 RepID=A0A225WCC5_9STRA|nr:hypothetical protein PHMEG_00010982 [Phytophthora megakarya]